MKIKYERVQASLSRQRASKLTADAVLGALDELEHGDVPATKSPKNMDECIKQVLGTFKGVCKVG